MKRKMSSPSRPELQVTLAHRPRRAVIGERAVGEGAGVSTHQVAASGSASGALFQRKKASREAGASSTPTIRLFMAPTMRDAWRARIGRRAQNSGVWNSNTRIVLKSQSARCVFETAM
jgi:hypothetical protein